MTLMIDPQASILFLSEKELGAPKVALWMVFVSAEQLMTELEGITCFYFNGWNLQGFRVLEGWKYIGMCTLKSPRWFL